MGWGVRRQEPYPPSVFPGRIARFGVAHPRAEAGGRSMAVLKGRGEGIR